MKRIEKKNNKTMKLLLAIMMVLGMTMSAYSKDMSLMLQQRPNNGGTVTPGSGLHSFDKNEQVTLIAVPKPGYQFVYWLGDVSDTMTNSTVANMDSPKIIVAVFEKVKHEQLGASEMSPRQPSPRIFVGSEYSRQGGGGGGGKRPHKRRYPYTPEDEPEEPEDDPNIPVPSVPEPATGLILTFGSLGMMWKKRNRTNRHKKTKKNENAI